MFDLLTKRRFLPLFLAQFLSAFNDNVFKNALIILMTYKAGEATGVDPRILVTAASGIFILPFFLFSATAGQIADKFEKSRLIRLVRLWEVPVMLLAALGFLLENYWMLMIVLFCAGTMSTLFSPLKYSILPEHLKKGELVGGNALIEAGTFVAILLGTILGGILIMRAYGPTAVSLILVAIAFFGWVSARGVPKARAGSAGLVLRYNIFTETWALVRQARAEKDAFLAIIGISWFWLLGFTFLAQFPVYASGVLGANEEVVTLFLTVFSAGVALGSLICNKLLKGRASVGHVPLGGLGMTAGIVLLWFTSRGAVPGPQLIDAAQFMSGMEGWAILLSLLMVAVSGGIYIVPLYVVMQTRCAPSRRSRVVAANNVLNALFMVMGAVGTMLLLKLHMGVTGIFLIVGAINAPVALHMRRIIEEEPLPPA